MGQVSVTSNTTNLNTIPALAQFVTIALQSLISTINGNVELTSNIKSSTVTASFTTAGTAVRTAHTLGRVPIGYIVMGLNAPARIYNTQASDANYIYPISDAAAKATILVF